MRAVVYNGPRDVSVKQVDDPRIEQPTDALVKITTTNICGSDLHMYEGRTDFEQLIDRGASAMKGRSLDDIDELGERLFGQHIVSRIYPEMRELVRAHQARGHTVVLSSSALTRSRSAWSMTAISPGFSRRTSVLVRRSTRATPAAPGGASALPRVTCGNLTDGPFIGLNPARARRLPLSPRALRRVTGCCRTPAYPRWGPRGLRAYGGLRDCVVVCVVCVVPLASLACA